MGSQWYEPGRGHDNRQLNADDEALLIFGRLPQKLRVLIDWSRLEAETTRHDDVHADVRCNDETYWEDKKQQLAQPEHKAAPCLSVVQLVPSVQPQNSNCSRPCHGCGRNQPGVDGEEGEAGALPPLVRGPIG